MIREATAFLLDVLKPDLPEHSHLQTKVTFVQEHRDYLFIGCFSLTFIIFIATGSGN